MTHVGKYQLVSKLATGGMAEVFLAKAAGPMGFEKTLVLKRILPHLAEDSQFVEMFFTEARVAAQLNHPNVVQIFDFGQAEGTYYLAMEHIDGPDLRTLSKRATQTGVQLPPAVCAKIASAACEGLAFAHDFTDPGTGEPLGLIHRDISPDNILLSRQGAVKVVDFGIAKAANQSHKTRTGLIKGKIAYMPPEQLQGHVLDRRVDVYALGVVLYELLTGQTPFNATTDVSLMQAILFQPLIPAASRRADLPEPLTRILDKALTKVRENRYPDCVSFQADLERFILSTGEPVGARELAQWVARLAAKDGPRMATPAAGHLSMAHPPGGQDDDEIEATAVSPWRTLEEGKPAQTRARTAETDVKLEPTRLSIDRTVLRAATSGVRPEPTLVDPTKQAPAVAASAKEERAPAPRRNRTGLVAALGGLMLLAAGGAVLAFRMPAPAPVVTVGPPQPASAPAAPAQAVVAQAETPPTPPQEAVAPVAAASAVEPESPPAEPSTPEPVAAAPESPAPTEESPAPAARRKDTQKGRLVFRIRPYATVLLDGTALGQTPLKPVQVAAGSHTVRLINRDLAKDITRTVEVKPGQSLIFKYDLEE